MDRETMIRMFDFSSETMETRIQQNESFKVLKKINNQLSYQPKKLLQE